MASAITKKTCAKCNKGGGTAICYGCEQSFCTKHFIEHRQDLSQQMDDIGQEHDVLCRDLTHEQGTHPLLTGINQWEQESIIKIQTAAASARTDLQQLLNKATSNVKTSVSKMTEELQSSRESDGYTELDIKKWTNQLQELRKMLDSPPNVKIDYEKDTLSIIRLIKLIEQQLSNPFHQTTQVDAVISRNTPKVETSMSERFVDIFGKIQLSENGLVATCFDDRDGSSGVSGIGRYSSGVHYIRFRIEQLGPDYNAFFGIINSSEKTTKNIFGSKSRHGWWDLDHHVVSGITASDPYQTTIKTMDEVTFMLDCDNRRIQLEHHRTSRIVDMSIDLRQCGFPWKIIVLLIDRHDCVQILR